MLNEKQLVGLARRLQRDSADTQEATAARLGRNQGQVSKALKGETKYRKTCFDIIALYSEYEIEDSPLYRLRSKTS